MPEARDTSASRTQFIVSLPCPLPSAVLNLKSKNKCKYTEKQTKGPNDGINRRLGLFDVHWSSK